MDEYLNTVYKRLFSQTNSENFRYLIDSFKNHRLNCLIGARGTGKTTMLLQFIKYKHNEPEKCFYVSMDNIYFSKNSLVNFVNELYETQGIEHFFLDEIHSYPGWHQEIKNIYDANPAISIVFSGSSTIDITHGLHDLSRRAVIYNLKGLSFREYLDWKGVYKGDIISLEKLFSDRRDFESEIAAIPKLRYHFKEYLKDGYYPFFMEGSDTYSEKLFRIIEKIVYYDIANFYKLKTENLYNFKKILAYIATIPPGELNTNSISKHIGIDNKTVQSYLQMLEDTGLVYLLSTEKSQSHSLKGVDKIYLDNPNLYTAIANETGYKANPGSMREIFTINMLRNSGHSAFYTKTGDIYCEGKYLEIGGKNKNHSQLKDAKDEGWLLLDNTLYGSKREIPLHLLGFLY